MSATDLRTLATICAVAALAGCPMPPAIGGPCDIGAQGSEPTITTITNPALECEGRTCIRANGNPSLCSAECGGEEDCNNLASTAAGQCQTGFTCAVAVRVGAYACRRFCLCRDHLDQPNSCSGTPP